MKPQNLLLTALVTAPVFAATATPAKIPFNYQAQIELFGAHAITRGNAEVKVGIIGTGLNAQLEPFRTAIAINEREANGKEGTDDDGNGYVDDVLGFDALLNSPNIQDETGPSTSSASLILSVAPLARIVPIKAVSDIGSGTTESLFGAINYAIARKVDVLLIGIGGQIASHSVCSAIQRAASQGISVVVTAGNEGKDSVIDQVPAGCREDTLIVVASSDTEHKVAAFSSYNSQDVDVGAPGVDIEVIDQKGQKIIRSGGTYSSAITAGVVALAKSLNPLRSPADIRNALLDSVDKNEHFLDKVLSGGIINARKTLETLSQ